MTGVFTVVGLLSGVYLVSLNEANARRSAERQTVIDEGLIAAQAGLVIPSRLESTTAPLTYPIRDYAVGEPEVGAASAIVFDPESERILFAKDEHAPRKIASLTKLATTLAALDSFKAADIITIAKRSVETYPRAGNFLPGERFRLEDMLKAMLIASSNDAATAIAEQAGLTTFMARMNKLAADLGLERALFENPTGLDAGDNRATAIDVMHLVLYTLGAPELWNIMGQSRATIYALGTRAPHVLVSTNELLNKFGVIGGKTGYTTEANGTYAALFQTPGGRRLGLVVLGSSDRFGDARALIEWVNKAYQW